jgi:hypothetical protein
MSRFRPRLTYANVISTVCLVLLVGGGTAFAASTLGKESIGARQLKKEAVTPAKLSAKAKSALTGPAGPAGPKGAAGATGPAGPAGPAGAAGTSAALSTELVDASTANDTTVQKETSVACPSGTVLGGGFVLNSNGNPGVVLRAVRSYAPDTGTWLVRAINGGTAETWQLTVVATCRK